MFGLELTGSTLFWAIVIGVVALLVELVLFKAACALADIHDPSWLVSILIVLPFFAARAVTAVYLFDWFKKQEFDGIPLYLLSFLASGGAFWIICVVVYALVLSISLKKGLFTASAHALLDALIGSLAIGITLFVLSLVQIKQGPANKSGLSPTPVDARVVAVRDVP